MENITKNKIKLSGAVYLNSIEKLYIIIKANEHGIAKVEALINEDMLNIIENVDFNQIVKVLNKDIVLFCGIIQNINFNYEGLMVHLKIDLISLSKRIDFIYRKRSFQNINKSIGEILKDVNSTCLIDIFAEDESITNPIYQIQETDWQFMRRMASRLHTCIYPNVKKEQVSINIGLKNNNDFIILESENYSCGVNNKFFSENNSGFIFYEIELYVDYEIGAKVIFNNETMYILEKEIFSKKEEIIYRYKIGKKKSVYLKTYSNLVCSGLSLSGKVIATKKQYLKIHLNIDSTQLEEEAYWYEWLPETGNIMYCMPQKGTQVQLYFKNENEDSAIAINCIRENGQACKKMTDADNKYFENENGKELCFMSEKISLSNNIYEKLIVDDVAGIRLESSKIINLVSSQKIKFKAKKIILRTPTEIKIIQGK